MKHRMAIPVEGLCQMIAKVVMLLFALMRMSAMNWTRASVKLGNG